MIALYCVATFWSAALVFAVEPMFARLVLPLLGGAPAVWNTSMVFFQTVLLAAYVYAHLLTTRVPLQRQWWVHLIVCLVAVLSLPIAIVPNANPPTEQTPVFWLLTVAALTVGLPFFTASATSPLLQRWFASTDHPSAIDPYFLFAASNLGSMVALLGYPTLVEPHLGLQKQGQWWAAGYCIFIVIILLCAMWMMRRTTLSRIEVEADVKPLPWLRRCRWLLLAFVPSSLMLSVTNYISMDVAAIPLLWVVPLAIYLLTFTLAFARRQWIKDQHSARLLRLLLIMAILTLAVRASAPLIVLIPLHLLGLFAAGLVCHRQLAADRPPVRHLTEFYLYISVGGVLGGVFNALLAPMIFQSVTEYPVGLLLAALLLPQAAAAKVRWRDVLEPVAVFGLCLALSYWSPLGNTLPGRLLVTGIPAMWCFSFAQWRLKYALGLAALIVAGNLTERHNHRLLFAKRTFFGIHRVEADSTGDWHWLFHGTTLHGMQRWSPSVSREPTGYYTRSGPLGQAMEAAGSTRRTEIATIGMGTSGMLGYASSQERWTFYEIDPAVEQVARDPRLFTFFNDCPARVNVVLGDARLTLRRAPDNHYDVIILDAYNSDAIPLHLITREAVKLYCQKLRPDGILIWHITNRHLDIEPVVAALARDAGLVCLINNDTDISPADAIAGKVPSRWAVMARERELLGGLAADGRWAPPHERPALRVWTDDYANLFQVFKWRPRG